MDSCIEGVGRWFHDSGYLILGRRDGRNLYAHRAAYEDVHGPIPPGLHIHHKCGNKTCINVDHMEALTVADHQRRHRRECGHDLAHRDRWNRCRVCKAAYLRAWKQKRLALV